MSIKYRLHSNAFERETEEEKVEPKKVFFLSVEGNDTEREYFEGISSFQAELGINAVVKIEVLRRRKSDTKSKPKQVIDLLEEYLDLRSSNHDTTNTMYDFPKEIIDKFSEKLITDYINDPLSIDRCQRKEIDLALRNACYDISYRKYLKKYNNPDDKFVVIIDRDAGSNSVDEIKNCIEHCQAKRYSCYISNPCFELWLLFHLKDVEKECTIDDLKKNIKVSNSHTFVSKQVSEIAKHGKDKIKFKTNYKDNIGIAIQRAKSEKFASDNAALIDNVGTNIWKLIEEMKMTSLFY